FGRGVEDVSDEQRQPGRLVALEGTGRRDLRLHPVLTEEVADRRLHQLDAHHLVSVGREEGKVLGLTAQGNQDPTLLPENARLSRQKGVGMSLVKADAPRAAPSPPDSRVRAPPD